MILNDINQENAPDVLRTGNLYQSLVLKENAFKEICKMFPDDQLPENLMDHPEKVRKLIKAKNLMQEEKKLAEQKYERKLKKLKTK
jgi:hypothetical protein